MGTETGPLNTTVNDAGTTTVILAFARMVVTHVALLEERGERTLVDMSHGGTGELIKDTPAGTATTTVAETLTEAPEEVGRDPETEAGMVDVTSRMSGWIPGVGGTRGIAEPAMMEIIMAIEGGSLADGETAAVTTHEGEQDHRDTMVTKVRVPSESATGSGLVVGLQVLRPLREE